MSEVQFTKAKGEALKIMDEKTSHSDLHSAEMEHKYLKQAQLVDADLASQSLEFDKNDFHCKFRMYPYRKLEKFLGSLGESLSGKKVVVLGCGKGFDFFLLKCFFPNVHLTGVDISSEGVSMIKKTFPDCNAVVGDMENLEFDSNSFDYALIPAALHHLQDVYRGLYEGIRVTKKGVILLEPYDSPLARLATRLGFAHEYEDVGNYVFRTNIREMKKVGKAMFMDVQAKPYFCPHYTARSYLGYYAWLAANWIGDFAASLAGNECIVYFQKDVAKNAVASKE